MRRIRVPKVAGVHDADGCSVGASLVRKNQDVGIIGMAIGLAILRLERSELARKSRLLLWTQGLAADGDYGIVEHRAVEQRKRGGVERLRAVELPNLGGAGTGQLVHAKRHRLLLAPNWFVRAAIMASACLWRQAGRTSTAPRCGSTIACYSHATLRRNRAQRARKRHERHDENEVRGGSADQAY